MADKRRRPTLDLTHPVFDSVFSLAETAYPESTLRAALAELLLLGAGTEPLAAATVAARREAFLLASAQARALFAQAFTQAAEAMKADAAAAVAALVDELRARAAPPAAPPHERESDDFAAHLSRLAAAGDVRMTDHDS